MPTFALIKDKIQQKPYLWVCFAMIVGVMGTALASPLYPLYQQAWQLSAGDITVLYVAYMFSALSSLLFLGRMSDQRGFIVVLRVGLILVTIGIFCSAFSWDYWSFMFSRVCIGLASSLIVTSASIGLTRLNRSKDLQRAAATTSLLIAFGFGLGPVIGGIIAQWSNYPLLTSYIPSLVMGFMAIYALFMLSAKKYRPEHAPKAKNSWKPTLYIPKQAARAPFLLGSMAAFTAFSIFSLFASLAPSFMRTMVPWHGPIVSGLAIGVLLFMSSGFQLLVRKWPLKRSLLIGLCSFVLSNLLLIANIWYTSVLLFSLTVLFVAIGHGLCLIAGMSIINKLAQPEHRSAITSSYLVIAYLGAILPILAIGFIADYFGMNAALTCYCISLALLSLGLVFQLLYKIKLPD